MSKHNTGTDPIARQPGPIEQTPTQIDNYTVRPEFFEVRKYSDPIDEPYHGQSTNDPDAESKSNERFNRGSLRAEAVGKQLTPELAPSDVTSG